MKIHSDSTLRALNKYVLFKLVREREEMWTKLKEWLKEVQINSVDIDEWTIIEVRNKVEEIESGK